MHLLKKRSDSVAKWRETDQNKKEINKKKKTKDCNNMRLQLFHVIHMMWDLISSMQIKQIETFRLKRLVLFSRKSLH